MQVHVVTVAQERLVVPGEMVPLEVRLDQVPWSTHFAVVLDRGEQRSSGYGVAVQGVDATQNPVVVRVALMEPPPGGFVLSVLTRPHAVALVPRAGLGGHTTIQVRDENGRLLAERAAQLS